MIENQKITFTLPGDITVAEIIGEILKNNGLQESDEEFLDKFINDLESRTFIIKDATLSIVEKKIPEKKLIELLQKHLETSQENAEKIISDIKQRLIPFAKIIDLTKETIKEELLKKINANKSISEKNINEPQVPYLKKAPITNVEKNAENIKQERKPISSPIKASEAPKEPPRESKPDPYKEPIDSSP